MFKQAKQDKTSPLDEALENLALIQNEDQFNALIGSLISERQEMKKLLAQFGVDGLYQKICDSLNIQPNQRPDDVIYQACLHENFAEGYLWQACKDLANGTKTDQKRSIQIQSWLEQTPETRQDGWNEYISAYLKTDHTIRKTLATKKIVTEHPETFDALNQEAERIFSIQEAVKAVQTANITRDLFLIGDAILSEYQKFKTTHNVLDFDDLITRTIDLLNGKTSTLNGLDASPWIRFKLDQGIDHILVDEAQDTNPEQWEIIQALCHDFFDGDNAHEHDRTVFVCLLYTSDAADE